MSQTVYQVDAFTNEPFSGNPAAICILDQPASEDWMKNVAREMNLSETAFLVPQEDGFDLRWFTPTTEMDLCGHATLASAHVLWESGVLPPGAQARFHTRSGLLTADRLGDWIEMDFPSGMPLRIDPPPGLDSALGAQPSYVGVGGHFLIAELDSESAVANLQPNIAMLKTLSARNYVVTSRATSPDYDFVSRMFGPNVGIDEDPVTGSSHCLLGPYWQAKLRKNELVGYQASARGGIVRVRVQENRVMLGGQAVTVLRGDLM